MDASHASERLVSKQTTFEGGLRKRQTPFRFRNWATEIFRSLDPFLNHGFDIRQSFLVGSPICRTTRQFRHFGNERLIVLTPIDD